jgi:hypothetical protein
VRAEPHSASQRVRRCRSGVIDRYTDIEHVHLDGDDDDGVEFRSEDEAGYCNGRDSDGSATQLAQRVTVVFSTNTTASVSYSYKGN